MTGKVILYNVGRHGARASSARIARLVHVWESRCTNNPARADAVVLFSSAVGFPPFIVTSLMAGAVKMNLLRVLVVGSTGRLIHFGAVVLIGDVAKRVL